MSSYSPRRSRRTLGVTSAASLAVVLACGGSSTSPSTGGGNNTGAGGSSSSSSSSGGGSSSGSTGTPDDGGGASSTEDSGAATAPPVDGAACPAKGSEVVMIGDSYFALSETTSPPAGEITKELLSLASSAGALATGDSYRYYYESGANMALTYTSTITPIPTQFANAVKANPDIKYVLMDGGGNDILLENTDCIKAAAGTPISSACQTVVQNAVSAASTLFQAMKTAGVEKIVYFFYPHLPTTNFPSVNAVLDYSAPLVQAACAASPVPCYFVDTRPAFNGNDATYIGPDNIHPTTAGSDVIAHLLWSEMTQACVALSP